VASRRHPGITVRINDDGSKSYEIRWRQGGGRSGRRYSHSFDKQSLAAEALRRIHAAGNVCHCAKRAPAGVTPTTHYGPATGVEQVPAAPPFGQYARAHVDAKTGVGKGYRAQLHRDLDRHLAPFLTQPLDAIGDRDVREWIRGLEEGTHPWTVRPVKGSEFDVEPWPLSPTTIRRLLVQAGDVMAEAQREGLVRTNPFRGHRVGRADVDRHEVMRLLSAEEWAVLEAALPEGLGRDLARVLVGTGLRFGEATALRVGDVDLLDTPPRLHVRQAWKDNGAGGWELGPPKSRRSRRTLAIGPAVVDALAAHVVAKEADELVFTAPRGGPVLAGNFYHRVWAPAVDRAVACGGLSRRPRVHDLRHTYASWQLAAGVALLTVSRRLGHETAAVTSDIYGHLTSEAEEAAVDAVEAAMTRGR